MPSALFSPIELAGATFDNRIVVSPMCQYSAIDGCATDWHLAHLGMLCSSGAALVVIEATHVERYGRITHGCMGLYSDECEVALARVISFCRRTGTAKLGIQLAHAGRKASSQRPWQGGGPLKPDEDPWETIAPSALSYGPGWPVPRAMTDHDIERVCADFAAAAARAVRIGFDAIELHMAHGYLAHSFISPLANRRDDRYGGSLENRLRFAREVAEAARKVVPRSIALGARITGSDWLDGGLTGEDAVACARMLKETGLDYVDISSGGIAAEARNPATPGYNVPIAAKVRNETGLATRTVGLIVTPKQADSIIASGQADMISMARAVLDDPHWGWHAADVLGAEVRRPNQYLRSSPAFWPGLTWRNEAGATT
jgi:2,4-dienoyl-CoA reductase-like NADH-dependent reductase (Old Yellow Enzyme family)